MEPLIHFVLLLLSQLIIGMAFLKLLFKLEPSPQNIAFSILFGLGIHSLIPFSLELFFIPLSYFTIYIFIFFLTIFLLFTSKLNLKAIFTLFKNRIRFPNHFILLLIPLFILIGLSIWRAFYFPPFAVDITSGAEAVSMYTLKEKTLINSVFDVYQNGNTLKPAFLTSLQVIYKLAGFPFGQIWLSQIVICFLVILAAEMKKTINEIIVIFLLILFLAIPEMYAYTYSLLYDYPNLIYFTSFLIYLNRFIQTQNKHNLYLSSIWLGFATYIRPETILLGVMLATVSILLLIQSKKWFDKIYSICIFSITPTFVYLISVYLYIHFYLPTTYSISAQINHQLFDFTDAWMKIKNATIDLFFSAYGISNYSYFPLLFILITFIDIVFLKFLSKNGKFYLMSISIVYVFFPLLSHVLPGMSIDYTIKRAYFKLFPLMLLYFANCGTLLKLTIKLDNFMYKGKTNSI